MSRKTIFLWKILFLSWLWIFAGKISGLHGERFRYVCQNCIRSVLRFLIWIKFFCSAWNYGFRLISDSKRTKFDFWRYFFCQFVKTEFCLSTVKSWRSFSSKKTSWFHMRLQSFSEKSFELWQMLFDSLVTTTLIVPRGTFLENIFFWKKWSSLSVIWGKIFDRFAKLPPMCPEEHVDYKNLLKQEKVVFILFRLLRKDFLHSSGKLLAVLTILGLTYPEHQFEDNWFMWNIHLFLTLLVFWAEKLWEFLDETIRQDCHNCSLCVRNNSSRKGFFCKILLFPELFPHSKLD